MSGQNRNSRTDRQLIASSGAKRKSDKADSQSGSKRQKTGDETQELQLPDVIVQTGLYAAEMLAANFAANYVINLIVIDNYVWVWYYDRQSSIQSAGINFIRDLPRFLMLLCTLQQFTPGDWGRNQDFKPILDQQADVLRHTLQIKDVDLNIETMSEERVSRFGLNGRATNVAPVTSRALEELYPHIKDGMVIKAFWGEQQRDSEPTILVKVKEIANKCADVETLGISDPQKGSRVLYLLDFRKLRPITELTTELTGLNFLSVWWQCVLCHRSLWQIGIHHRDVSSGNLMYYKNPQGDLKGVLNDYDLASLADQIGPKGNERTGTIPFMALELLTWEALEGRVTHLYRHDVESFVWVLAWVSLRYKDGHLRPNAPRPLDAWAKRDAIECYEKKSGFLSHGQFLKFIPKTSYQYSWNVAKKGLLDLLNLSVKTANALAVGKDLDSSDYEIFSELRGHVGLKHMILVFKYAELVSHSEIVSVGLGHTEHGALVVRAGADVPKKIKESREEI
ncbi:hypothetical protein BJ138DRAFT_1120710 [Hygrophoropsis aurantiaca]|uniref:Uncharacterized protein n=1 Tax=Hygrophoropsis aurantiaca TaxID=72124 RepID=A0ACB7ZQK9_9AGAM|nr:hypothetical protein BJ138DRAFT_1120710 [Hygrophoropsis aurantiaca]